MHNFRHSKIIIAYLFGIGLFAANTSCSTQRYLEDGQIFLRDYEIKGLDGPRNQELRSTLKPKPNKRILGIPVQAHFYAYANHGKSNFLKKFLLKRFNDPPVLSDSLQLLQNTENLRLSLINTGYFQAKVSGFRKITNKGANEIYKIDRGAPYKIQNFSIQCESDTLRDAIFDLKADNPQRFPAKNQLYNSSSLNQNRAWLVQQLREQGFYRFGPTFVEYFLDSSYEGKIDIQMVLKAPEIPSYHERYKIKDWQIEIAAPNLLGSNMNNFLEIYRPYPWLTILNKDERLDSGLLIRQFSYRNDLLFSENNLRYTLSKIARLDLFSPGVYEMSANDTLKEINIKLLLNPLPKWNWRAETEISTNSISLFGLNGALNLTRRNAIRLGDLLELKASIGAESQQLSGLSSGGSGLNTLDWGLRSQISIPGIFKPGAFQGLKLTGTERTQYFLNYQRQQRRDFDRNVFKAGLGISGLVHNNTRYEIFPFEITFANTGFLSSDLQQLINSLNDPFLKANFASYVTTGLRGSWSRDRLREKKSDYVRIFLESSGNAITLFNLLNYKNNLRDTLFKIAYFRFLKADVEYRKYLQFSKETTIATRFLGSFGLPLGNQGTLPLEKRAFAGGANSLRAWPVRGLGPGALGNYSTGSLIQFGEIRLEGNLEWRFKISGPLSGAVFVDAGNIWTLNDSSFSGLGNFEWNRFIGDLAINQGVGVRFDVLGFFVFRVDFAIKLRDPAFLPNNRWLIDKWLDQAWKSSLWRTQIQGEQPTTGSYPLFSTVFGINFPF